MPAALRPTTLCALLLLAGCSIDFDRFLATPADAGAPRDSGVVGPTDLGVPPADTGAPTADTGNPPVDTGTPPTDTGAPPTDRGNPVTDTGVVPPVDTGVTPPVDAGTAPAPCRAPYLVAVAENLDANAATLLRWSFADDRRCDPLPLRVPHPRAAGVAFDTLSDLGGPQLVVVNADAVHVVDAASGDVIRDLPVAGQPRSVFDIVSNGAGTFAVAYSHTGDSPPGSVGSVRVFDHRNNNLREVQSWQRNQQTSINLLWATGYPGNQGQYLQLMPAETGGGYSAFVASPSSTGFHPRTTPALIANRNNARSLSAYRSADRRGRYAMALSGTGTTPAVYVANSGVGTSTVSNVFVPTVRCAEPCPAITRAVAFPDEDGEAAAICEVTGTQYTVVRVGGASTGCRLLDTEATPGRWRINDLAVMPR